jgi:hypothetical protein
MFKLEIFKSYAGENWANTYLIDTGTLTQAAGFAEEIAEIESGFHLDTVTFDYVRASTLAPGDNSYVTVPQGFVGERGLSTNVMAPLWVTVRADIAVDGAGSPSRKYYRGCLVQDDYGVGVLDGTVRSNVAAALDSMIVGGVGVGQVPFRDPDGQEWTTATAFGLPQMRQLHRKRRRAAPAV